MVSRGRSHELKGAAVQRRWRPAFAFFALLAIFLQAFVVQTHVHPMAAPIGISVQQGGVANDEPAHITAGAEHQLICAICQALASSGVATLPSVATVLVAQQTNAIARVALALAPNVHTHSWRSRAPPSFL